MYKTICISLTTLIALFFAGQYLYGLVPRYEVRQEFIDGYCFESGGNHCYTRDKDWVYFPLHKEIEGEVLEYFCEDVEWLCYVKTKIRIN